MAKRNFHLTLKKGRVVYFALRLPYAGPPSQKAAMDAALQAKFGKKLKPGKGADEVTFEPALSVLEECHRSLLISLFP